MDSTNRRSFDNIPDWLREIDKYTDEDVKKILLVNKCDLDSKIEVTEDELMEFEKNYGVSYLYTSAKTGYNVDQGFMKMTQELIVQREMEEEDSDGSKFTSTKKKYQDVTNLFRGAVPSDESAGCCAK